MMGDLSCARPPFGEGGRAWRETDVEHTDVQTVLTYLLDGQYSNPVRVIAFNTAEGWWRDVSEDVAHEVRRRCAEQARGFPSSLEEFGHRYHGYYRAVSCRFCSPAAQQSRSGRTSLSFLGARALSIARSASATASALVAA